MTTPADQPPAPRGADVMAFVMARVGMTVPPDRTPGVLSGVEELAAMAALMRRPRPAETEPAAVFDIREVAGDR